MRDKPGAQEQRVSEEQVVDVLRSAYRETVEEAIPDEFLDLLGKLS